MDRWYTGNEGFRSGGGDLFSLSVKHTIRQAAVSVGVTATALPASALSNRIALFIFNESTNIVYIGDSSVSSANGFPLYPKASLHISIEDAVTVYGIAGGASDVRIIEGA